MKPATLFRISAVLFVLFAAGHTFGFLSFKPSTAAAAAVRASMDAVPLEHGITYGGILIGFGLYISAYLFFSALLSWNLAVLVETAPRAVLPLAWGFFALQLISLALACIYFAPPPAVLSAAAAGCSGAAALGVSRAGESATSPAL